MTLLTAADHRPDVANIHVIDVDASVLISQIKSFNTKLSDAIEQGGVIISVREPTKSLLAAIIIDTSSLILEGPEAVQILSQLELSFMPHEIDFGNSKIAASLEAYEPSAFRKEVKKSVSELPE